MDQFASDKIPLSDELGRFADQTTPLIRNCWYVAGLSGEISRELTSRRILGVDVALYRTLAGSPVAVRNRCPHRSFPLVKGRLDGDILVCGYHGMQFDPSGRCTNMPAMPNVPSNAYVRTFPIAERGPLVWIWMGNPDLADEELIPVTEWLDDPRWASVTGYFRIQCDYVAMHENLLDQSHFPFLHPGTVGTPEYARAKLDVRMDGDRVVLNRALKNSPPPGIYGVPAEIEGKPIDRYSDARFASPAIHTAYATIVDPEPAAGRPGQYRFNITHLMTPETQNSIHYWWFNSRDFKLDDAAADKFLTDASAQAYFEDVEALQWISEVVQQDEEPQFDLNFAPDKPGLLMRRVLYRLAAAEADGP
jgi:phenylpropionate dioxygenase-like ring-hydroxylating dioxygenase large terminal subunit